MADTYVLFDAACGMCRSLAGFMARRAGDSLALSSWQEFQTSAEGRARLPEATLAQGADRLRVLTGKTLLEGEGAWQYLLANYRDLAGLHWLAERAGLVPQAARGLERTGRTLRRLCVRCGR